MAGTACGGLYRQSRCRICIASESNCRYIADMPARRPRTATVLLGVVVVVASASGALTQAPAPSARTWLGRESQIEAHLKSAKVIRMQDVGTGVTLPRRAFVEPAEPVASFAWKVLPPGRRGGYW